MSARSLKVRFYRQRFERSFSGRFRRTSRAERVHVGNGRSYFAQAYDQCFNFVGCKIGQQSLFALEGRLDDFVVKGLTCARQLDQARSVVVWIGNRRCQAAFSENVEAPAHRAFIQANSVDDLVGTDVRKAGENAHNAPLGDAYTEVLSVGVGCSTREPVRYVSEKIWNVSIEIEDATSAYFDGSSADIFLHKQHSEIDQRNCGLRETSESCKWV